MPASVVLDIAVISEEIFIDYLRLLFDCCRVYDQQISTEELYLVARFVLFIFCIAWLIIFPFFVSPRLSFYTSKILHKF